jgi:hypothetical protein
MPHSTPRNLYLYHSWSIILPDQARSSCKQHLIFQDEKRSFNEGRTRTDDRDKYKF